MSNTHCRFCDITVKGLYLNCPRCGKYLVPEEYGTGPTTPPEPFELVEYGKSWMSEAISKGETDDELPLSD